MTELEKFDALLKKTLSISKEELQRRIEAQKSLKSSVVHGSITSTHGGNLGRRKPRK